MTHLNDYLIPCKNEDLAKAWTDGDPLGGGLPAVTSADEGKVLTVNSEGAWGAEMPSGVDDFYIGFNWENDYRIKADKTYQEIVAAAKAGKVLKARPILDESGFTYQNLIIDGIYFENEQPSLFVLYVSYYDLISYTYDYKQFTLVEETGDYPVWMAD